MESSPRRTRAWILAGVAVVGIVIAVLLFRVVFRAGKRGTTTSAAATPSSSCGCAWPGTTCVGSVCELAPKASWNLTPMHVAFAASSAQPAPTAGVAVCTRATGTKDWKCTKPASVPPASSATTQQAAFGLDLGVDGAVVVTTEVLHDTGIDIEVRRGDTAVATASGLHHKTLRPGAVLFQGGLRFGAKATGVNDVLYRFTAVE